MTDFWCEDDRLKQAWRTGQRTQWAKPLGRFVEQFVKKQVVPRQRKMLRLGSAWQELLPDELVEHSCLASLRGGRLRVLVDDAAHLHELDMLLREGLLEQLRNACPSVAVREVKLSRGCWYRRTEDGAVIPLF